MRLLTASLLACGLAAALPAGAYCLHNDLKDREVYVEQAQLKSELREGKELRVTIKPGEKHCCRNLDCNPGGRSESIVELFVTVMGQPRYLCAPERLKSVTVTGAGVLRILDNPRKSQLSPYVVKIRTAERDVTGPSGVPCLDPTKKGKP